MIQRSERTIEVRSFRFCGVLAWVIGAIACGTPESSQTSSSSAGSTSGAGGGGSCDRSGECGDQTEPFSGCFACAEEGPCRPAIEACTADADCVAAAECDAACPDLACVETCATAHPHGTELLLDVAVCLLCDVCPIDCKTDTSQCP
jgi:hypothetical protein